MKVINAMFGRGLGGIEQVFLDYALALHDQGIECINLTHPKAAILASFKERRIPYKTQGNMGSWDAIAKMRFRTLIAREKPDAIICHGNRALLLLRPAAKSRSKLVGVAHNYWLKSFHFCDAAIAITEDLVKQVGTSGLKPERIYHVPNMVEVPGAMPQRRPYPTTPIIGTMGRFVYKKGFDLLIEALRILRKEGLAFDAIIAGDGDEAPLLTAAKDAASFPGWVTDKQAFWNGIDIFCLPSRHEPFGIVLLEAMAQGLPIASTASEGPSTILTPGKNALVAPLDDVEAIAAALRNLLKQPDMAAQLGTAAYAHVKSHYSREVIGARLKAALEEILRKH